MQLLHIPFHEEIEEIVFLENLYEIVFLFSLSNELLSPSTSFMMIHSIHECVYFSLSLNLHWYAMI